MPLTGKLGTASSELANIELGIAGGGAGRTGQTIQAKADIKNRVSQSVQARARIGTIDQPTIQARAHIPAFTHFIFDSFDRADSVGSLGTADSGQTWSNDTALTYHVASNQAAATSASFAGGAEIDSGVAGTTAAPIQIAVDCILDATDATGVIFRSGGPTDNNRFFCYLINVSGTYNIRLIRELGGSFSGGTLIDQAAVGGSFNAGETHRLVVILQDTSITVFVDDVRQGGVVTSTFLTNTWHGIFISGTSGRLDNFNINAQQSAWSIRAKASINSNLHDETIQAKANINASLQTRTLQAQAHILQGVQKQLQAKAHISIVTSQTIDAKARLTPQQTRQISARANLFATTDQEIQAKAWIRPPPVTIQAKAEILGVVTADLEIDFNVQTVVFNDLLIIFNATTLTRAIRSVQAKAKLVLPVTATLGITFDVGCSPPTLPVLRPTQRIAFRGVRNVNAKARIVP